VHHGPAIPFGCRLVERVLVLHAVLVAACVRRDASAGDDGRGHAGWRHDPNLLCPNCNYYRQQYLADSKNPYGYCPDHGTGVACPVGVVRADG
jgi:hypothetical protein